MRGIYSGHGPGGVWCVDNKIPCEVVSRVCGYLTPIQNWNVGKQAEYRDRVVFVIPNGVTKDEQHVDCNGERAE